MSPPLSPLSGLARRAAPLPGGEARPLLGCRVRVGLPSPADDHLDVEIDLHAHVVRRPAATCFVRAEGDSMLGEASTTATCWAWPRARRCTCCRRRCVARRRCSPATMPSMAT
ncbi:S24 family peptidase [Halomonas maura]|uniref:S24 family peptidase n=1 Tax=Halomonas maura TaxID=117606 RepID=UPI003F49AD2E